MPQTEKPAAARDSFQLLKDGILLSYQKRVSREPEYDAINSLTDRSSYLSKINQYATDIEKNRREMEFAITLLETLPDDSYLKKLAIPPEDYVLYHLGYFLELVHQMKDKVLRLTHALCSLGIKKYQEPDYIKLNKVLKLPKLANKEALINALNEWNQETDSPLAKALKNRSLNHHFRSTLHLTGSYQDVKVSKLMLDAHNNKPMLSDYGVQRMKALGEDGFVKWHSDTVAKMKTTKELVEKNLLSISKNLRKFYKLPSFVSETGKRTIAVTYGKDDIKKIKNKCSLEKLQKDRRFYDAVKSFEIVLQTLLGTNMTALYVIGSAARGEAKFGFSDLNLVVVTKQNTSEVKDIMGETLDKAKQAVPNSTFEPDIRFLSEDDFSKLENFKTAFSCATDGVLISGQDVAAKVKYPDPGLGLGYLLNRDFKENLNKVKERVQHEPQMKHREATRLAKQVVKQSLRMMFAATMGNHAVYAAELPRIKDLLLWEHPKNLKSVGYAYQLLRGTRLADRAGLEAIVSTFTEQLYPLFDTIETKTKAWFPSWEEKY